MKRTGLLSLIGILVIMACKAQSHKNPGAAINTTPRKPVAIPAEKFVLSETFQQNDSSFSEYLLSKLRPIRANFKRINSIIKWTTIHRQKLEEPGEGGEASFYFSRARLEKVIGRHYGETFQQLNEYYLLNGKLSFVFEKSVRYNRPIYYDSSAMKANNDTESFNPEESNFVENRCYFLQGKLVHLISNQDCGSPFTDEFLNEEQKRIMADFNNLVKVQEKK